MEKIDRFNDTLEAKAQKTAGSLHNPGDIAKGILQVIAYQYPKRKISVNMSTDEFTCVCPFSGLPDFAKLTIRYTPAKKLVEMKSLKYYLHAYRNVRIYNEHAVNKILEDLVSVLQPVCLEVEASFTSRGGMLNTVIARYPDKK